MPPGVASYESDDDLSDLLPEEEPDEEPDEDGETEEGVSGDEALDEPRDRSGEIAPFPTRFLFWNLKKQATGADVAELANSVNADVVLLAETGWKDQKSLNTRADFDAAFASYPPEPGRPQYQLVAESEETKVPVYTRLKNLSSIKPRSQGAHYVVWELRTDSNNQLLLAACHFPAHQTDQGDAQRATCLKLRLDLERAEKERTRSPKRAAGQVNAGPRFRGSIVVGDLNAPPWAPGLVATYGLHATHLRRVSTGKPRKFMNESHPWFYNPMWRFLHRKPHEAQGTYYLRGPGAVGYEWHILDQVLIRPSLLDFFKEEELRILTDLNGKSLLDDSANKPNQARYSDHLPIVFDLHQ